MSLHRFIPINQELQGGIATGVAPVTQVQVTLDTGDVVVVSESINVGDLVLSNPNGSITVVPAANIAALYQQVG